MKTLAISTLGWDDGECDAFEQYAYDLAYEYGANITITHTVDSYFEVDMHDYAPEVEYLILRATKE